MPLGHIKVIIATPRNVQELMDARAVAPEGAVASEAHDALRARCLGHLYLRSLMKAESPLKAGALAACAGVGVQTLHYYERLGLLPKAGRSAANYRLYPPAALRRVRFIKQAQSLGFTLEELKRDSRPARPNELPNGTRWSC